MKKRILILALLSTSIFASSLPLSWVNENTTKSKNEESLSNDTAKYFNSILNAQSEALDIESNDKSEPKYQLSNLVTDFSVTKSGLFGLSALKATNNLAIVWSRKKTKDNAKDNIYQIEQGNKNSLLASKETLLLIAKESGKIKDLGALEKNLDKVLTELNNTANKINKTEHANWKLTGLRVELTFSASGKVWTFASAGSGLKIRLEWKLKKRPSNKGLFKRSRLESFVNKSLIDIEKASKEVKTTGFSVSRIDIGVGIGTKGGFLGLGSSKSGVTAYLHFVRNKKKSKNILKEVQEENITLLSSNKGLKKISRKKYRKGIAKSFKMMESFAKNSKTTGKKFYVSQLKGTFVVSHSGFFGFSTASAKSVIQIVMNKN